MGKLIMGIGLPASGKSKTLIDFAEKYHYTYLAVDDLREARGMNPHDPKTEVIWDEMRRRTQELLAEGETIVVDATFVESQHRRDFLTLARRSGAEKIQGVFVDTPSEVAWERNLARQRTVPRDKFQERVDWLNSAPPELTDGFDALFTLNENQELVELKRFGESGLPREKKWMR